MPGKLLIALVAGMLVAGPAAAQERTTSRIAAVVNDELISLHDLHSRVKLILLTSRVPNNADTRRRLMAQVLRTLINERLQLQEAKRLRIEISDREIAETLAQIEQRNKMPSGRLLKTLRSQGVHPDTLVNQVRANLAWSKVIQRAVRSEIQVSEGEVDDAIARLSKNKDRLQYSIREIFLAVDSSGQDAVALRTARQILTLIRRGASFASLARQFSQSSTASEGGDMGTVFEGQLEPELEKAIKRVRTGQVIGPIRTSSGYYILQLLDRRTFAKGNPDRKGVTVAYAGFMPDPNKEGPKLDKGQLFENARKLATEIESCRAFVRMARAMDPTTLRTLRDTPRSQLPEELVQPVSKLRPGQTSNPFEVQDGYAVAMLCKRAEIGAVPRNEVWQSLLRQKLSIRSQQYMRDLRRAAFVDIRV